jgi:hypothetical protein
MGFETLSLQNIKVDVIEGNLVDTVQQSDLTTETSATDGSFMITKSNAKPWLCLLPYAAMGKRNSTLMTRSSSEPSSAASASNLSQEAAAEVKRRWRQGKISVIKAINCVVDSSWRTRQTTVIWSGWLQKRSSGIVGRWQTRWFELRQEPITEYGLRGHRHRAVLQYTGRGSDGGDEVKRLELIDARRDCEHDLAGCACLSVEVAGRSGHVLLGAGSDREAASLLSCIALFMRA